MHKISSIFKIVHTRLDFSPRQLTPLL